MRLIDADELKKKLKLWAFNNVTTTSPTFDFVTEFDIDECPTVDVLDKIRAEIKALSPEPTAYDVVDGNPIKDAVWETLADVLQIIDRHMKGDSE